MLGAIAGDIIGSIHEYAGNKSEDFPLFTEKSTYTDDSVLTIAVAEAILKQRDYGRMLRNFACAYPNRGYGMKFTQWIIAEAAVPYNSFGNGSAMRVSPVAWAFGDLTQVLEEAKKSAEVTHNHPEGVKGAQAVAAAIFLGRTGKTQQEIKNYLQATFHYNLDRSLAEIRPQYFFDETCQGSVPEAITAFLESSSFEDAVRKAISLGGDADTQACVAGSIAEAFYHGVPVNIAEKAMALLDPHLAKVVVAFMKKYCSNKQ